MAQKLLEYILEQWRGRVSLWPSGSGSVNCRHGIQVASQDRLRAGGPLLVVPIPPSADVFLGACGSKPVFSSRLANLSTEVWPGEKSS